MELFILGFTIGGVIGFCIAAVIAAGKDQE